MYRLGGFRSANLLPKSIFVVCYPIRFDSCVVQFNIQSLQFLTKKIPSLDRVSWIQSCLQSLYAGLRHPRLASIQVWYRFAIQHRISSVSNKKDPSLDRFIFHVCRSCLHICPIDAPSSYLQGPEELASAGIFMLIINIISKLFNIPLLSVSTSIVVEDISRSEESDSGKLNLGEKNQLSSVFTALLLAIGIGIFEGLALLAGGEFLDLMGLSLASFEDSFTLKGGGGWRICKEDGVKGGELA